MTTEEELDYKAEAAELAVAALAYDRALQCIADTDNGTTLALAYLGEVKTRARRVLGLHVLSSKGDSVTQHGNRKKDDNEKPYAGRRKENDRRSQEENTRGQTRAVSK